MKILGHTKNTVTVRLTRNEVKRLQAAVEARHGRDWSNLLLAKDVMDGIAVLRDDGTVSSPRSNRDEDH